MNIWSFIWIFTSESRNRVH